MATNQEIIDAIADNAERVKDEIVAAIKELKNQPPESLNFSRLEAAVGGLDDLAPPVDSEPPAGDGT